MPIGKMPIWWRDYLHLTVRWSSNDNIMIPLAEVQPHMTSHSQPLQNHILGKHVDCFSGLVWRQKGVRRERQVITKLLLQLLLIRLFLLSRTTPEEMTDKLETFHIVFSCLSTTEKARLVTFLRNLSWFFFCITIVHCKETFDILLWRQGWICSFFLFPLMDWSHHWLEKWWWQWWICGFQ